MLHDEGGRVEQLPPCVVDAVDGLVQLGPPSRVLKRLVDAHEDVGCLQVEQGLAQCGLGVDPGGGRRRSVGQDEEILKVRLPFLGRSGHFPADPPGNLG
jgi:hypothetical protein